jgi:hypothetical protein
MGTPPKFIELLDKIKKQFFVKTHFCIKGRVQVITKEKKSIQINYCVTFLSQKLSLVWKFNIQGYYIKIGKQDYIIPSSNRYTETLLACYTTNILKDYAETYHLFCHTILNICKIPILDYI